VTFVLIPGAWMGAWVWEAVARDLASLGHRAVPITLAGLESGHGDVSGVGLATHVEDVLGLLDRADLRDVVLVGHSYSGFVAGQVAGRAPGRVSHTVFVQADRLVGQPGRTIAEPALMPRRLDELRATGDRVLAEDLG
jgi:pimeloyl-ACP methyl ester carboxylesterase